MANHGADSTTVVRQRAFNGHPVDVEKATETRPNGLGDIFAGGHSQLTIGPLHQLEELEAGLTRFWKRFTRKGKKNVPVLASLRAIALSSCAFCYPSSVYVALITHDLGLNVFVIFIPLAWIAHFLKKEDGKPVFGDSLAFTFCFLSIVPLEWLFHWGGEQMAHYLGTQLGDLVMISLNNVVEATLAILLLKKCELRLLQSTIVGVVILHLLLIPGTAFIVGGASIMHQELHPHVVQLNHTLLTLGQVVLCLLLPAAFFSASDRGAEVVLTPEVTVGFFVNDTTREKILTMSRGLSVILLTVYICSRIFLHNPPGKNSALLLDPVAPTAMIEEEKVLLLGEPKANQYVLIAVLALSIAIMAATTEFLVESIEFVRAGRIEEEWFGMFLLPIVSWAANGFVAIVYFIRYLFRHLFDHPEPPAELAKARAIDRSIQFTLFWMPFIVMLGWWIGRPMSLLFDFFEIAIMLGACFIVNYVTADAKTNWAEGFAMVAFYCMIAICAWFYTGQSEISILLSCKSIGDTLAAIVAGGSVG
ncbi:hypothetical protein C0991_003038 [Blastosporella zonata]|nr:hypothetical protein C0991_003038 [Blastosporella zonata]